VLDALQEVMGDDTKVARLVVEKRWSTDASTTIEVAPRFPIDGQKTS
jgi:hypothetical protein